MHNLLDAIKLYCHVLQCSGGGLYGRNAASNALAKENYPKEIITYISECVSNDGHLTSSKGSTFALTQISSS